MQNLVFPYLSARVRFWFYYVKISPIKNTIERQEERMYKKEEKEKKKKKEIRLRCSEIQ